MANTHTFETRFSKRMQVVHYKKDVFRGFASFEERANLKNGQAVVRPYRSTLVVDDYTRGSDVTIQDLTDTNETLTVNTSKVIGFSIDDLDALQSNYRLQDEYAHDAAVALGNNIDGKILAEVANATSVVDAGDVGGSAGSPITLSTSNVLTVLFKAGQYLNEQNIAIDNRFGVMSPQFQNVVDEYTAGRETPDGDKVGINGFVTRKANFDLMMSNNLYWTGVLSMATQPTDGDTVVIGGVTFTFKTVLGATPGNVLIGASADAARANLTALVNAPGTTTAQGVALSTANQNLLKGVTATNDNGANTMTVAAVGKSYLVVSETFTDVTDAWGTLVQHNLFGRKGAVDVVIQKEPTVKVNPIPKQHGVYVLPLTLFGQKTFQEGAKAMVDVQINTASF